MEEDRVQFWQKTTEDGQPGISVRNDSLQEGSGEGRIETGQFHAHSKQREDRSPAPLDQWEPLFTPFDDASATGCRRSACSLCERLEPHHGHLNKVAWWTAKFAGEMFAAGPDREAARQWGFIAGLWHDLGKFSIEIQYYLQNSGGNWHDEAQTLPESRWSRRRIRQPHFCHVNRDHLTVSIRGDHLRHLRQIMKNDPTATSVPTDFMTAFGKYDPVVRTEQPISSVTTKTRCSFPSRASTRAKPLLPSDAISRAINREFVLPVKP